jgi:hypothetical protein
LGEASPVAVVPPAAVVQAVVPVQVAVVVETDPSVTLIKTRLENIQSP